MSLFLKWLHHLAVLSIAVLSVLPQLQFWCNNSFVEEKDKEAAFSNPIQGKYCYIHIWVHRIHTLPSVEEVYSVSVPFCVFVGPIKTFMASDFVVYMCTEKLKKKQKMLQRGTLACPDLLNGPILFFIANQGKSLSSLRVLLEVTLPLRWGSVLFWKCFSGLLLLRLDPKVWLSVWLVF